MKHPIASAALAAALGIAAPSFTPWDGWYSSTACAQLLAPQQLRITDITIEGNSTHSAPEIKRQMKTKAGAVLNTQTLDDDIDRLYALGWFYDVNYRINNGTLVINVVERNRVAKISFEGRKKIREYILREEVSTEIGDFINPYLVKRDLETIKKKYRSKGYVQVEVTPKYRNLPEGTELIFSINVNPNVRVKRLSFEGNKSFKDKKLRKIIKNAQDRWWNSGLFKEDEFENDINNIRFFYISQGYINATVNSAGLEVMEDGKLPDDPDDDKPVIVSHHRTDDRYLRYLERQGYITEGGSNTSNGSGDTPTTPANAVGPNASTKPRKKLPGLLTFKIDEGKRYYVRNVKITNDGRLDSDELMEVILPAKIQDYPNDRALELETLKRGGVYAPQLIERAVKRLKDAYGNKGFMFTRVTPKETLVPDSTLIDIEFHIVEGHPTVVREVTIIGNDKSKDKIIRRELEFFPGEQLLSSQINDSRNRLRNLNYFEGVSIDPEEIPGTGQSDVTVKVKEKSTGQFRFGLGFSSVDNVVGSISITQHNFDYKKWPHFTGGGQTASITLEGGSNNRTLGFSFKEPYLFGRPIRFGFGAKLRRREGSLYDQERRQANFSLGKALNKHTEISSGLIFDRSHIFDIDPDASFFIQQEAGFRRAMAIPLNLEYSTLDNIYEPTRGRKYFVKNRFFIDGLGGELELMETTIGAKFIQTVRDTFGEKHHIVSARAEVNSIGTYGDTTRVPIFYRYYAGGQSTVRGYENGYLSPQDTNGEYIGGRFRVLTQVEYSWPLYEDILRGAVFFDAGNSYSTLKNFSMGEIHKGVGFGIRFKTPLGPIPVALDYGFALDRDDGKHNAGQFDFNFGAQF